MDIYVEILRISMGIHDGYLIQFNKVDMFPLRSIYIHIYLSNRRAPYSYSIDIQHIHEYPYISARPQFPDE